MTNMQLFQHIMSQFTSFFVSIYSQKGLHTLKLLDVPHPSSNHSCPPH
jgi:hypothetical protein